MGSKILAGIYLIIVGICVGGCISCYLVEGTISNIDVLFRANEYTDTVITRYDQGIILADFMEKFSYIAIGGAIFILWYETLSFIFQKSVFFVWILNILNSGLMLLFGFFYSPKISTDFASEPKIAAMPNSESLINHTELVLQILCIGLIISFFSRIILMDKRTLAKRQNLQKDVNKQNFLKSLVSKSSFKRNSKESNVKEADKKEN